MVSYSATRENKMPLAGRWMDLEIMVSKINQAQKIILPVFLSYPESRLFKRGLENGGGSLLGLGTSRNW